MKADQLNRFMRTNGRKNLWLLRNTNTIYEQAVKSYYQRSNSLLPYNPMQEHKKREENRAPVRTLTSQKERGSRPEYPRNHKQMAEQMMAANSGNLLNTVMQANRRRSMSFTGYDYIYPSNESATKKQQQQQPRCNQRASSLNRTPTTTATTTTMMTRKSGSGLDVCEQLDLGILGGGRSISLPPRSSKLDVGVVKLTVRKAKEPPCHKHHIDALEKSTSAAAAALARHKRSDQRRRQHDDDTTLMTVDEALKQRLAVLTPRPSKPQSNNNNNNNNKSSEQTRFQTLGERIRQFERIQFADGPTMAHQAINRRQSYGSGRAPLMAGGKHIPKQQPCLSFRNVLHTNHRQRCLNGAQTRSQSSVISSLPQSQQPAASKLKRSKSKRCINNSNSNSSNNGFIMIGSPAAKPNKPKAKEQPKSPATAAATTTVNCGSSRSSHMPYIKHCGNQLDTQQQQQQQQLLLEEEQQQPAMAKGAHHLLAASASQVSAYRRAFKNRQQILQAELLHIHAQDEQQPATPPSPLKQPKLEAKRAKAAAKCVAAATTAATTTATTATTTTTPLTTTTTTMPTMSTSTTAATESSVTTLPELASEKGFMAIDAKPKWSPALQQQQLHQQLRQRRQQPYDGLWRYNY